jgi:hypothetical protein
VAAFLISVALHAGPVMWVETLREETPVDLGASFDQLSN